MLFRQLFEPSSCSYTYLLADEHTGHALIIDSVKTNTDLYLKLLEELELTLKIAVDTHLHADHITGAGTLKQKLNCQVFQGEPSRSSGIDSTFSDGSSLRFGQHSLTAIYTPGHTDDSYCFYSSDLPTGMLFTGDTLLIRRTGRTDFQNGSALVQYKSIFKKLFTLPDNTQIYPGHDYQGLTMSTIREEKRHNSRLKVQTAEEYADLMKQLNLPRPKLMDIALPENLKLGINETTKG